MAPVKIESESNPRFRAYKSLLESKGVKKNQQFLIFGESVVHEALSSPLILEACLLSQGMQAPENYNGPIIELDKKLFKSIDEVHTGSPILVAHCPKSVEFKSLPPKGLEVVLPLQDPNNLGAALRVCEAFNVQLVILTEESAHPFHYKSVRASMGSSFRVPLQFGPKLANMSLDHLVHLDMKGTAIKDFEWPKNCRIVLGEEGQGVPELLKMKSPGLRIPMKTGMDSLNAVSALSIALYDFSSR